MFHRPLALPSPHAIAAATLAGMLLLGTPMTAAAFDEPNPPSRREVPQPRGPLGGPRVSPPEEPVGRDRTARERGERPQRPGRGEAAMPGGREVAEILAAVRRSEPTPEQQQAIRELLASTQAATRTLMKELAGEFRQLLSIRRELLAAEASAEQLAEVDARIAELRAKIVDPKSFEKQVLDRLDPPRQAIVRETLEAARKADASAPGRGGKDARGGRPGAERDASKARQRLRDRVGPRERRDRGDQAPPPREDSGTP